MIETKGILCVSLGEGHTADDVMRLLLAYSCPLRVLWGGEWWTLTLAPAESPTATAVQPDRWTSMPSDSGYIGVHIGED